MGASRTVSKRMFSLMNISIFLILTILELIVLISTKKQWGARFGLQEINLGGVIGGFAFPNLVWSNSIADRIYRHFGMSRSGKTVEERQPAKYATSALTEIPGSLEVHYNKAVSNALAIVYFAIFLLVFLFAELIIPRRDQTGRTFLVWLYVGTFLVGVCSYLSRYLITARLDEDGVYGFDTSASSFRKRFVAWQDIAECEITTHYDTLGKATNSIPTFKDKFGAELLKLNLGSASETDRDLVLSFIVNKLPKNVTGLAEI